MKTCLPPLLALLAVACVASPASSAESRAQGYRLHAIETSSSTTIQTGATEFTVRRILGAPARQLDANTWVYASYRAVPARGDFDDCRTLIITFDRGLVADLQLVNERAEKAIVARIQARHASAPRVAAK